MTLMAVPFDPRRLNDRTADILLDGMVGMPTIFPTPGTPEDRRVLIAAVLTDCTNRVSLVWQGGALVGAMLVTDVRPGIDAQGHFVFFDRTLFGRKQLMWNFMGRMFAELALQRISVEIPETIPGLIRFVRNKLHFKFEGEGCPLGQQVAGAIKAYVANPAMWLAKLGSRREHAYWDGKEWVDMARLRILREEYVGWLAAPSVAA